ncbi:MAG: hypothetical protein IKJ06_02625 [Clostridia bacterium]|nr:hypothetical protein [Clostridia bacterium]
MFKRTMFFCVTIILIFSLAISVSAFNITLSESDIKVTADKTGYSFKINMNSTTGTEEAHFFFALYDEDNRLISITPFPYTKTIASDLNFNGRWWKGRNDNYIANFSANIYPEFYPMTLKIFAWSTSQSIYPVTNCVSYTFSSAPSAKATIIKDMPGFIAKLTETTYQGYTQDAVDVMETVGLAVLEEAKAVSETEDLDIEQLKIDYNDERVQISNIYHNLMSELEQVEFQNIILEVVKYYPDLKELMMDIFNISI